jgi:hypothetical protein
MGNSLVTPSGIGVTPVLRIWRHRRNTTAMARPMYRTLKSAKVMPSPGIGVTASAVRMTPCTIHGWRPTSVTVHPASRAMKPSGAAMTSARRNRRSSGNATPRPRRRCHQRQAPNNANVAITVPQATMI